MIRLLVIHRYPLIVSGIRRVLEQASDMQVLGATTDPIVGLALVKSRETEIVVLDADLPGFDPTIIAQLRGAGAGSVFVLTNRAQEEQLFACMMGGAAAYELDCLNGAELIAKIRRVSLGEYLISGEILGCNRPPRRLSVDLLRELAVRQEQPSSQPQPQPKKEKRLVPAPSAPKIGPREVEILKLVLRSKSNLEIATSLRTTRTFVSHRLSSLFELFAVRDRTALAMAALRCHLLTLDDASEEEEFKHRQKKAS